MYKIGEFSKITFLTVKALRYYDDIGLLIPAKTDEETNYRYYDDDNFRKAMYIKLLKNYDFTIKEIQEIVPKINDSEDLSGFLLEKHEQIQNKIASFRKLQKKIENEVDRLKEDMVMSQERDISIIETEEVLVASIRYKGKYEDVGIYLKKIYKEVGANAVSAPFSLYYDEDYTEENADIEIAVPIKKAIHKGEVTSRVLKKQKCVSYTHIGPYDKLSVSYKAIADYIKENNLETQIPSREIYLKGPGMLFKGNPDKYETQILMPIK